jgi:antitoxin component YwqK of YwqJK toxin-antitoxin module
MLVDRRMRRIARVVVVVVVSSVVAPRARGDECGFFARMGARVTMASATCELTVVAGKTEGVVRELHPGGTLLRAEPFKGGERVGPRIELTPDGKVVDLVCAEKSFVKEDRGPCGHDGKVATVSFFDPDGKPRRFTVKHERGRRLEQETVDGRGRQTVVRYLPDGHEEGTIRHANGKTARTFVSLTNGRYDGAAKEWNEAGQLLEDDRYAQGKLVAQKLYFQNGAVKLDAVLDEKTGIVAAKQFRGTGKLSEEGAYKPGRCWGDRCDFQRLEGHGVIKSYDDRGQLSDEAQWSDGKRDGYHRVYHRNGKVATEETYKAGTRTRLKCLDPGGATELEEEYFEDGSRKAAGRAVPQEERDEKRYCVAR